MPDVTAYDGEAGVPVLIIEDDPDLRDALEQTFSEEGYEVVSAGDGGEALALLRSSKRTPRAIVLDLYMPRVNGFEFRAAQLANPDTAWIPVVVVTAGGVAPKEKAALGLAYVLHKPVDIDLLLRVVRRLSHLSAGEATHADRTS